MAGRMETEVFALLMLAFDAFPWWHLVAVWRDECCRRPAQRDATTACVWLMGPVEAPASGGGTINPVSCCKRVLSAPGPADAACRLLLLCLSLVTL